MPNYSTDGTENLEANAKTFYSPGDKTPPAGKGEDAGGDKASHTLKSGSVKATPGMSSSTPSGVQSFNGEAT